MCNKMLVVVSTISASNGRGTRLQVLNLSYMGGLEGRKHLVSNED